MKKKKLLKKVLVGMSTIRTIRLVVGASVNNHLLSGKAAIKLYLTIDKDHTKYKQKAPLLRHKPQVEDIAI